MIIPKIEGIWEFTEKKPVTFVWGDNLALLRWMKAEMMMGYFNIGIVDPPYGINIGKLNLGSRAADRTDEWKETNRQDWDGEVPTQEYWDLLRYVCRKLIVWGGNYFTKEIDWAGRCFVVWDKGNDNMSFAPCELALTDFDKNAIFIRKARNAQKQDGEKRHPTQKPVYLYDKLHLDFVEKKWRVLDTHGGSFSHAIAAWKNNVDLTIIDKSEIYYRNGIEAFVKETQTARLLF